MRIEGVGRTRVETSRHRPRETPSRALTTVAPAPARGGAAFSSTIRPDAAVLVQLFAARDGLPQARERRRAEPALASAAYRAALRARRSSPPPAVDLVA